MALVSPVLTVFVCFIFTFCWCAPDGAEDASVRDRSIERVAKGLKEALKAAQESFKSFYSDDPLTFVNSLLNPAGTVSLWIRALATAHRLIPPLFDPSPPSDQDLQVLKGALKDVVLSNNQLTKKYGAIEPGFPNEIILSEFRDQTFSLSGLASAYSVYSEVPSSSQIFLRQCESHKKGEDQARWIANEISGGGYTIPRYFDDSCNYTEIVLRSRQVAGIYMKASQLFSFCFGVEGSKDSESDFNSSVKIYAGHLDEDWEKIAKKFVPVLMKVRQLKDCMPIFTDAVDFYSKRNKGSRHEPFAQGLATHLFEKFPWINWYVFSYDDGLGGDDEHFCIDGILSNCIQRKYGRNLFVAGQQKEDNYFYNKNCPEQNECVKKLDQYKNCEDATKPFEQCIREKCKPPAGTLCKKSSDGFAAEKGSSAGSDGWNKASFGTENKYSMHVVSP